MVHIYFYKNNLLQVCRLVAIWLLLAVCFQSHAQSYSAADTTLIKKILLQAEDSNEVNPNAGMQLTDQAISISKKIDYKLGYVRGLIAKGSALSKLGKPDEAIKIYTESLRLSEENGFKKQQTVSHIFLGSVYDDIGDFKKSITHCDIALKAASSPMDTLLTINIYNNLGTVAHHMYDYAKASGYFLKAVDLASGMREPINLEYIYTNIAANYIAEKDYKSAFLYLKKSIHINDSIGHLETGPIIYMNLAICYDETGNKDSALYCYFKALKQFQQVKDVQNEARLLNGIGTIYYEMERWNEAEKYYKLALAMAKESSNLYVIAQTNYDLSTVYFMKGDYKKAFLYRDTSAVNKDSLYNQEQIDALAELTTRYKTQEIAQQNAVLQKENDLQRMRIQRKNILVYSILGVALLFLTIGFLLVRQGRLRTAKQRMELEQKQLLAQINPHFIFNCLNSIQQFIVLNDTMNANKYLADFALLMRQTLDNSKDGIISLQREMEYLENYLSFEHMRFEDKFTYSVQAAPNVDAEHLEIPSMIIQPFVENAVRHGLCNLEDRKGVLDIRFYIEDGFLYCSVDDNGIGMDEAKKLKEQTFIKYKSLGMELTRQRLALVSKLHSHDYTISIINKQDSRGSLGTTVIIKFPLTA